MRREKSYVFEYVGPFFFVLVLVVIYTYQLIIEKNRLNKMLKGHEITVNCVRGLYNNLPEDALYGSE